MSKQTAFFWAAQRNAAQLAEAAAMLLNAPETEPPSAAENLEILRENDAKPARARLLTDPQKPGPVKARSKRGRK